MHLCRRDLLHEAVMDWLKQAEALKQLMEQQQNKLQGVSVGEQKQDISLGVIKGQVRRTGAG